MDKDIFYMKEALKEAEKAYKLGEVPVGAVIVKDDKIIARGHNLKQKGQNPVLHGEIIAIYRAAQALDCWHLGGSTIYASFEPCLMCLGAILNARIDRLVIGARDWRFSCCGRVESLIKSQKYNHTIDLEFGVLEEEASQLISKFFSELREGKINEPTREDH